MDISEYNHKKKELYLSLLNFLDDISDSDDTYYVLTKIIKNQNPNEMQYKELFCMISRIELNHHITSKFYDQFGRLFNYLINIQRVPVPKTEIFLIFKDNIKILFFLLEKKMVIPDDTIMRFINKPKNKKGNKYSYYLYPLIKGIIGKRKRKRIEYDITTKFNVSFENFEEKVKKGENDSYICTLIREDSIEDFISYVNQKNLSLLSQIPTSFFETKPLFIEKVPTIIEYAVYYGSVQIINYVKNEIETLPNTLWFYGIHSNNPEVIQFLEDNQIERSEENSFVNLFIESIKCHHNEIADYIKENYLNEQIESADNQRIEDAIIDSFNGYFHYDIDSIIMSNHNDKTILRHLSYICNNIIISSSVTFIGDNVFNDCSHLTNVTFPSSVTSIGKNAFLNCSSLTEIVIPSSVTTIGNGAFHGCFKLKKVSVLSSIEKISQDLFFQCYSLTEISIPSSVVCIENNAFSKCASLKQISIPPSVIYIGNNAFSECSSLTEISIPPSVRKIGSSVFEYCSKLAQISIPSSITSFGSNIFTGIMSLIITGDIKIIPTRFFLSQKEITKITIPPSVTSIENNAFDGCTSLIEINIPPSVTKIGDSAFEGCLKLTQITIPSSVTSIGDSSFSGCSSLTRVSFENNKSSLISIGEKLFSNCPQLMEVEFDPNSPLKSLSKYCFDGCIKLIQIKIPCHVENIGYTCFRNCSSLRKVEILSSSLKEIESYAFFKCTALIEINLPNSVTKIGSAAFKNCKELVILDLPTNLVTVEFSAFEQCSSLKRLSFPPAVKSLGNWVLSGCSALEEITISSSVNLAPYYLNQNIKVNKI